MKKIFMLLALCLFCGSIFAQSSIIQPRHGNKSKDNKLKPGHSRGLFHQPGHQVHSHKMYADPVVKYRLDTMIVKYDEMLTGNYTNGEKAICSYNDDFQLTGTLQQSWYGLWLDYWKTDFSYNQMGLNDTLTEYEYTQNHWQQAFKETRTYNPDSTLQSEIYYNWNWTTFVPSQKIEYQYTGSTIIENWFSYENVWVNDYIVTYYLTDGRITSELCQSIYATGNMENDYKADYLYYANGDLKDRLVSYWEGSSWSIPMEKESYTYDTYNNVDEYTWSILGEEGWEIVDETLPEYNNDYTRDDLIIPDMMDDEIFFRHMLTRRVDNSFDMGELEFSVEFTLYYTPVVIEKAKNILTLPSSVFPNPATENITIRWDAPASSAKLTIYSSTGAAVASHDITNNTIIPFTDLKPGLYMYTLTGNDGTMGNGKFLVR